MGWYANILPPIVDEANVLSNKTENTLSIYNANWDKLTGSVMAVVTTRDAGAYGTDIEDAAWNWAGLRPPA